MDQHEAMTDDRLAAIRLDVESPTWISHPVIILRELLAEIDRMRACKVCDGARVLFNDGGTMRPAHGWTGPVVNVSAPYTVVNAGEAHECPTCAAMARYQGEPGTRTVAFP